DDTAHPAEIDVLHELAGQPRGAGSDRPNRRAVTEELREEQPPVRAAPASRCGGLGRHAVRPPAQSRKKKWATDFVHGLRARMRTDQNREGRRQGWDEARSALLPASCV